MARITCNNISLSYENNTVLSDVSFHVGDGDFLAVVGENGSGKSTLIKALVGLKPITKGKICFSDGLKSTQIGYLPQQSSLQKDFPASVSEVVLSGCLSRHGLFPFYSAADRKKARGVMEKLGILAFGKASYKELSGGQQQRVLLARALCATDKMLVLDEPTAGLDPLISAGFYSLIRKIHAEGVAVIMVSHDIASAVKYATSVLHLQNRSFFFSDTERYLHSEIGRRFLSSEEHGGDQNA